MSFFALLFALLIEQVRPLDADNPVHKTLRSWARTAGRSFDTGRVAPAWLTWVCAVVAPGVLAWLVFALLQSANGLLGFGWTVLVLYLCLGFRQFSHHFTGIRDALDALDEVRARELLADWQQVDASALPRGEIVRHVIEYSVLAAHRHVFGVLCWFSVLAALGLGPGGAVIFRMAEFAARYWRRSDALGEPVFSPALQEVAARAWHFVNYLPARATAVAFAIVGRFEDAIDSWRQYAQRFPDDNDGVILAATSGAIDVRLGGEALQPVVADASDNPDTETTPGRAPELAHLRSVVGLVWRSVVLWLLLLALLTLARVLG